MQLSFGANLHLIHKPLEKPLIYWAFSIKKLSEVLIIVFTYTGRMFHALNNIPFRLSLELQLKTIFRLWS
jgi:hypothetical protein